MDPITETPIEEKHETEEPQQTKKKRLLSDKQRDALRLGREKRWKKMVESIPSKEPIKHMEGSYSSNSSEEYDSFSDSSSDEETRQRRKQLALKRSIPKPIRRRLDRYIKKKLEESKVAANRSPLEEYYPLPPAAPPLPNPYIPPLSHQYTPSISNVKPAGPVFL